MSFTKAMKKLTGSRQPDESNLLCRVPGCVNPWSVDTVTPMCSYHAWPNARAEWSDMIRKQRGETSNAVEDSELHANRARFKAALEKLKGPQERHLMSPAQWCRKQILEIAAERGYMSRMQEEQLKALERVLGGSRSYDAEVRDVEA